MNAAYRTRIVILGAAGRDFHNFNVVYRDDPAFEIVAFTAAQIPGIADRRYPAALAGALYPEDIALDKPVVRARREFVDSDTPGLEAELDRFLARRGS